MDVGSSMYGQLGDNTALDRTSPVQIGTATTWISAVGGLAHSLAVKSDGTLWGWGYNTNGQLGEVRAEFIAIDIIFPNQNSK